jgi:SAM-dependent methyltransferase
MPSPKGFFQATEMPDAGWWEALWPDPQGVLAAVGMTPGMDVVDLCSGDGWFTLQIARRAHRVVAIDIDAALIDLSRRRLAEQGISNCAFVTGDACDIAELVRHPVDFVFLANVLHGVPEPARLARAVAAVLKPDGQCAIVNWHARRREETTVLGEPRGPRTELRMAPEQAAAALLPGGLFLKSVVDIPPYHYAAVFVRKPAAPASRSDGA